MVKNEKEEGEADEEEEAKEKKKRKLALIYERNNIITSITTTHGSRKLKKSCRIPETFRQS